MYRLGGVDSMHRLWEIFRFYQVFENDLTESEPGELGRGY